jgi:DNA-binding FadR family transcriptional regulator
MAAVSRSSVVRIPKASEMIATELRKRIVTGEIKEGDALPSETTLTEHFGVSRPTLREAFRILESEQLISVRRGVRGGARVLVPDPEVAGRYAGLLLQYRKASIADVYETRSVLETAAVATLTTKRTAADLQRLDDLVAEGERLMSDMLAYEEHDVRFHVALAEMSGNQAMEVLTGMLYHIIDANHRAYAATQDPSPAHATAKVVQRAHAKLAELIRAKDSDATEFWRKHLKQITNFMTKDAPEIIDILT